MPQRPQPSRPLHNYPGAILHHHHNNYVSFRREHNHPDDEHDARGRHNNDWTDAFYGAACYADHNDADAAENDADHSAGTLPDAAENAAAQSFTDDDLAEARFFLSGSGLTVLDDGSVLDDNRTEAGPAKFTDDRDAG